ncbi:UNVERIFIED_CONTAM: GCN5 family acetyltransferase [Mumia flava]|uniref:GNAT family N-acetyltransferase n=1 Tax=Mumia flava TaxID=1348852 RepID=UPI000573B607|nr:GNAT family N-acetyltransferase [Mumia flava]
MDLLIEPANFDDPQLAAFLQQHLDDMEPTAPPESRHALDLDALRAPNVRMWVVREGEVIRGTGAIVELEPGHEEIKSMRTDPSVRGEGLARRMLTWMLYDARDRGVERVSLETGSMEYFAPARALYASAGFTECAPFGAYREDPNSTFMTLTL